MSEISAKKPRHILIWILGGAIAGVCLGIIAAFIIIALNEADGSQVPELLFDLEVFQLGLIGAVIGGFAGLLIWLYKWDKS